MKGGDPKTLNTTRRGGGQKPRRDASGWLLFASNLLQPGISGPITTPKPCRALFLPGQSRGSSSSPERAGCEVPLYRDWHIHRYYPLHIFYEREAQSSDGPTKDSTDDRTLSHHANQD